MPDYLPAYNPRVAPGGTPLNRQGPNAFRRASDAEGMARIGAAVDRVGQVANQVQQVLDAKERDRLEREKQVKLAATRNETRTRVTLGLQEDLAKAKQEAPAGAEGFFVSFEELVQKRRAEELGRIAPGDVEARQAIEADFEQISRPYLSNAQEFQGVEAVRHRVGLLEDSLGVMGNAIVADPDQFDSFYQQGMASIDDAAPDLDPEARRRLVDNWKNTAAMASFNGMMEADPHQALEDAKGKRYDAMWSPDVKARAVNSAQAEIKRRDAEARAQQGEVIRRLSREVDGAIKVMSAGYQYRDIDNLREAVKGTELEAELSFHESVAGIRQEHAFRPVSEQIEVLRQIESQPQTEGSLDVIKALKPVTEEAVKAVQSGRVLEYARDHGVINLEPVDYDNPESWGNRLRRADAAAEMAGVGQANILTEQETSELAEHLQGMPAPEKIEWLAGMRRNLGEHDYRQMQGTMAKAKIEPGLDLAADMIARSEKNQPAAMRLLQAFQVDDKALPLERDVKKAAEDNARIEFSDGLGSLLAAQADVLSNDAGRLNMMSEMNEATRRLALSYAASGRGGGWFGGDSGGQAYKDLFGDYQSIDDGDVILFAEPTVGDIDDVADGLRAIRRDSAAAAVEWQKPIFLAQYGEQQGEMLFDEYVRDLQDDGVWINGQGGAVLIDPVQGSAIVRPDGTPYVVSFKDALSALSRSGADRASPDDGRTMGEMMTGRPY